MNLSKLRKLNFNKIIQVGFPDVESYTFDSYRENGFEHKPIEGYCVSCEEKQIHTSAEDQSYRLTNISHGSHSSDFLQALTQRFDVKEWNDEPVVFIYESPSLDYDIYKKVAYNGYEKHPSKLWYWVYEELDPVSYPLCFSGGQYGEFVLSALLTFKLANVYITNLVKCGLNNSYGQFKGLGSYRDECIENCFEEVLSKELAIIKPKVIFAVGSAVADWVEWFIKDGPLIQQLPHPAGRRRGFRDEHYKALYFWLVVRALHKCGIISLREGCELAKTFLEKFDTV